MPPNPNQSRVVRKPRGRAAGGRASAAGRAQKRDRQAGGRCFDGGVAWRIEEFLLRGEIDNRLRGRVTGRLWFAGRPAPVELELAGDAWRDLAGRRLAFRNPRPKPGLPASFAAQQAGAVGDITASRKVKVPDIPLEQIGEYYAARKPFPWHWGNSLYLEWFSEANGRVVIESADYELTIEGDATWEMTPEEEEQQRRANHDAVMQFMERLGGAVARERDGEAAEEDDDHPQTEEEAERMLEASDRLADRIAARMEREGPDADYEKILEEELEHRRKERGEPPLTPEEEARRDERIEELNRAMEAAAGEPDLFAGEERRHPLTERATDLAVRLHREIEAHHWLPADAGPEHPVLELMSGVSAAAAKMAGALDGDDYPPPVDICGHSIARLKRAAGYLADAQLGAEACGEQNLVDAAWLAGVRREMADLSRETDTVIAELRERLKRGLD